VPGRLPGCWPGCSPECSQTRLRSSARPPYLRPTRLAPAAQGRLDAACSSDRASDRIGTAPKAGVSAKGFARRQQWVVPILIARALLGDTGIHACAPGHYTSRVAGCTRLPCNRHIGRGRRFQVCSDAGAAIAMAPKPWAQTMVKSSCRQRRWLPLHWGKGQALAGGVFSALELRRAGPQYARRRRRPPVVPLPANAAGPGASQLGSVAATNPAKGLAYLRIGLDRRSRERPTHDHPP
jgi:hypothetical protein